MVLHPELGSDPLIWSDRESGRDTRSLSLTRIAVVEKSDTAKYRVRSSPSIGLTRMGGELRYVFNAENASSHFVSH